MSTILQPVHGDTATCWRGLAHRPQTCQGVVEEIFKLSTSSVQADSIILFLRGGCKSIYSHSLRATHMMLRSYSTQAERDKAHSA